MLTGWHGDGDFAECTTEKHSEKFLKFAECKPKTLGKVYKLCRVSTPKHSVKFIKFAECQDENTR